MLYAKGLLGPEHDHAAGVLVTLLAHDDGAGAGQYGGAGILDDAGISVDIRHMLNGVIGPNLQLYTGRQLPARHVLRIFANFIQGHMWAANADEIDLAAAALAEHGQ